MTATAVCHLLELAPGVPQKARSRRLWLHPGPEGEAGSTFAVWCCGAGVRPAAARRAGLEVVEKVLTTSIPKANRAALSAVKHQGIVAS